MYKKAIKSVILKTITKSRIGAYYCHKFMVGTFGRMVAVKLVRFKPIHPPYSISWTFNCLLNCLTLWGSK